jgi:hypothetical protein
MMREGFENILDASWLSIWPGLAILALVLGLNMVGDGLRDATDPKLSGTCATSPAYPSLNPLPLREGVGGRGPAAPRFWKF